MLAQFSIWPLEGQPMDTATADTINRTLEELDVEYDVGAIGTTLKGNWDQVMAAILACHQAVAVSHARVLTQITIDDQKSQGHAADEAISQARHINGKNEER